MLVVLVVKQGGGVLPLGKGGWQAFHVVNLIDEGTVAADLEEQD